MDTPIYRLSEAARRIGVAPITLKRWFLAGKVKEVGRDRNGWRVFTPADLERLSLYANQIIYPEDEDPPGGPDESH